VVGGGGLVSNQSPRAVHTRALPIELPCHSLGRPLLVLCLACFAVPATNWGDLPRVLFFVSGHVPPLLRNFVELFLDKGIARLFGEFFALLRLGAVLFCLARHHVRPRSSAR
jgi:hypothetical protein